MSEIMVPTGRAPFDSDMWQLPLPSRGVDRPAEALDIGKLGRDGVAV